MVYGAGIRENMAGKTKNSPALQKTLWGSCDPQGDGHQNTGGATTSSFSEALSCWLHPACQATVQPAMEERVEEGELLPTQNKCTQKWHR